MVMGATIGSGSGGGVEVCPTRAAPTMHFGLAPDRPLRTEVSDIGHATSVVLSRWASEDDRHIDGGQGRYA
jgi:hypothetical protein